LKRFPYSWLSAILIYCITFGGENLYGKELQRYEFAEPHMGTEFRLKFYAPDEASAKEAAKLAFARIATLNKVMSDYDPKSELSELCAKNSEKCVGPVVVSDDLFRVLQEAQTISELSEGAFDVTVGPVVRLWRVARKDRRFPDPDVLKEAMKKVGYQKIKLDPVRKTVELTVVGMKLDLGGIGKGFAAEETLKLLKEKGISSALVAASGDISVGDAPPGTDGWKVDIAPLPGSTKQRILTLKNAAVSTSGDASQFVEISGKRYSHVLDPRTGVGLEGRRSVTVIASRGTQADALTKMASVWEPEKAIKAIDKLDKVACLIIVLDNEGKEKVTQSERYKE